MADKEDSEHSILRSAKRFFGGTLLSRCSGVVRDMAMAYTFGTEAAVAAFLVAFRFAHLLRRLFGEGALQTAFVPYFEEMRLSGAKKASFFFRDLVASLSLFLLLLILVSMGALGAALALLDLSSGNYQILFLTLLLMPSLLFICLFGINASLLQCEKKFFTPGVAPVAFNLIWALGVFSLWNLSALDAMPWLAGWVIIACLAQWAITIPQTIAALKKLDLSTSWRDIHLFSSDVKKMIGPLFLGIIGVAASQINNALDAVFARFASLEGPAFLWYALRIQQLPLALFGIAIAGALLPPLTRALKNNDIPTFNNFLAFALQRTLALMLPITMAIFVMGDTVIQIVYGRGDFANNSIMGTSHCLWGYAAGLIPMTLVLILAPAFYAKNDYRTTSAASVFAMLLNVALNAWWILDLGWGTQSVAWATSVSAWGNFLWLAIRLPHNEALYSRSLGIAICKATLAAVLAGVAVIYMDLTWLGGSTAWQIWRGEFTKMPLSFIELCVRVFIQAGVFMIVWGGFTWILWKKVEPRKGFSMQG